VHEDRDAVPVQFASVERETGVESGRAAAVAPDRYNKWDNDITGTPGSRARPGPNIVIIAFDSPARRSAPPFAFPRDYANTFLYARYLVSGNYTREKKNISWL